MVCVLMSRIRFFFFKQKTAYEMRISDWSSDVCSSDLLLHFKRAERDPRSAEAERAVHARKTAAVAQRRLRERRAGLPFCRNPVHQQHAVIAKASQPIGLTAEARAIARRELPEIVVRHRREPRAMHGRHPGKPRLRGDRK